MRDAAAQSTSFIRPLGSIEHIFWLMDRHRPRHFVVAAEISGKTELAAWPGVLKAVQNRHPLFAASIQPGQNGTPEFHRNSTAPIPLRVVQGDAFSHWEDEIGRELSLPFNPEQAPLVRVVLIHAPDRVTLIFSAHHSIADALSIVYAVRDVLYSLSAKEVAPLPVLPSIDTLLARSNSSSGEIASKLQAESRRPGKPGHYREMDTPAPEVRRLRLRPDATASLRERAREEGTTIYGALCAALISAGRRLSSEWRDQPLRVMTPMDVRGLAGVDEDCGLFTTAAIIPFEAAVADTFWDLARFCKSEVAKAQAPESIAAGIHRLQNAARSVSDVQTAAYIGAQAFAREMVISNLGNLPIQPDHDHFKLEAIWGPAIPMDFDGEQTVGAATLNGSLCLLHAGQPAMPALLESAEQILSLACSVD